jgi:hypothetical protein
VEAKAHPAKAMSARAHRRVAPAKPAVRPAAAALPAAAAEANRRAGGSKLGSITTHRAAIISPRDAHFSTGNVVIGVVEACSSHRAKCQETVRAASHVRKRLRTVEAATPQEIESAFSSMNEQSAGAVIVAADAFFIQQGRQIAELARKHRMPSVFSFREQVDWPPQAAEMGQELFLRDRETAFRYCVVGPGGLELRARHTVHSNRSLCRSDWPGARETCAVSATEGTTKVLRKDHGRRAMWIAAVEGSRKMKPENPSFMCGLRGGLGGLELRAGDFFPPDFPVPPIS